MTRPVTVSPADAWGMVLYSVRYALGRRTYAVDDVCEYVLRYQDALETWQLQQIVGEISTWCEREKGLAARAEWHGIAARIDHVVQARKAAGI
jgi:hypothetical protein